MGDRAEERSMTKSGAEHVSGKIECSHPVTESEACLGIGGIGGEGVVFGGSATGTLNNNSGREVRVGGGYSQHRGRARELDGGPGRWGGRKLERGDRQVCKGG